MKTRFQGNSSYNHNSQAPIGILLTNLGTPDAPTAKALRRYLREFLSDPRVVEIPRLLWWIILNLLVLPLRPRRSAKIYQKIWTAEGSPLLSHMQNLADKLNHALIDNFSQPVKLAVGMRYGKPSIAAALKELHQANAQRILVLPLYPQYAAATTGSTFDAISAVLTTWRWVPELHMVNQYADFDAYIKAISNSINNHWQASGKHNHLLFSFHGIPKRSLELGDPYYCYCQKTARLVAEQLGLNSADWTLVFQSRFGRAEWLQPYCDKTLREMPSKGITEVDVICPGFAVDCLETLEEIAIQNRELFLQAGGKAFNYIPALNASDAQVQMLSALIQRHIQSW